jgi:hypothetical protein
MPMTHGRKYYDMPFIYGFDGSGLTDGDDYDRLNIPIIPDSEFLLRRVTSSPTIVDHANAGSTGRVQLWRDTGQRFFSRPQLLQDNYGVVPEVSYSIGGSQIRFDLQNVLRAVNSGGGQDFYWSQLCFQGVRRFWDTEATDTLYPYYEKPQTYTMLWTLDFDGNSDLVNFVQPINEYDFTLHAITIVNLPNDPGGEGPQPGVWTRVNGGLFGMHLYDKNQQRLSNMPIDAAVYAYNVGNTGDCTRDSVFPCPPLLYPVGSQIQFDVKSYKLTATPAYQIQMGFHGIWRLPCR